MQLVELLGVLRLARDLARAVEHALAPVECIRDARAVEDVTDDLRHLFGQFRPLADEGGHRVAAIEQRADEVATEETGRSGDEIAAHSSVVVGAPRGGKRRCGARAPETQVTLS